MIAYCIYGRANVCIKAKDDFAPIYFTFQIVDYGECDENGWEYLFLGPEFIHAAAQ